MRLVDVDGTGELRFLSDGLAEDQDLFEEEADGRIDPSFSSSQTRDQNKLECLGSRLA